MLPLEGVDRRRLTGVDGQGMMDRQRLTGDAGAEPPDGWYVDLGQIGEMC